MRQAGRFLPEYLATNPDLATEVTLQPLELYALALLVRLLQEQSGMHKARLTGPGFGGACVALCRNDAVQATGEAVLALFAAASQRGTVLVLPRAA